MIFSRLIAAICFFLAVLTAVPAPVQAQTSFGKEAQQPPRNHTEWRAQMDRQISRALRRSDTALNTVGANADTGPVLALTVLRDGRVAGFHIVRSSGNKAMDRAYTRSFSRIERVAPFSPDMQDEFTIVIFELSVGRG